MPEIVLLKVFVVLLVYREAVGYRLEEGSTCGDDEDFGSSRGLCKKVTHCAAAMDFLKKGHMHNFERCGFDGYVEIVCCPESDPGSYEVSSESHPHHQTHSEENWRETTTKRTRATTRSTRRTTTSRRRPQIPPNALDREIKVGKRKSELACQEYSNEVPPSVSYQILGGTNAKAGEFPHMVALGYNTDEGLEWNCGGTLISDRYVLTAAHCVIVFGRDPPVKARLGTIDLSQGGENDYDIINNTVHPEYSYIKRRNDIALLKLNRRVVNSKNVHPACLYNKQDDPPVLTITGWGKTSNVGNPSKILQKATVNPVRTADCNNTYMSRINKEITSSHICAASPDHKMDTCQGDSGGPLQTDQEYASGVFSIVGVTSYGQGCGTSAPTVYSRVYSYLEWIEDIVWG